MAGELIFAFQAAPNILKVSVIIPLYNQRAFVEEAVASALGQPQTGEVIVVDDGSTDGGGTLVRKLARENRKLIVLSHPGGIRRGVGATRNAAMHTARYSHLAFLDADDIMLPGRFEQTERLFVRHPEADGVAEALGYEGRSEALTMPEVRITPENLFFEMDPFGKKGHFSVCGLTVKKSAVDRAGGFDEELRIGEDTEWLARLVLTSTIVLGDLNRAVALRRLHADNTSRDGKLAVTQKPLVALKLLRWNAGGFRDKRVAEVLLKLFLKYHYEANHIYGQNSRWKKKRADVAAMFRLIRIDPSLRHLPQFRYFARTVLRLPVDSHLDYYD